MAKWAEPKFRSYKKRPKSIFWPLKEEFSSSSDLKMFSVLLYPTSRISDLPCPQPIDHDPVVSDLVTRSKGGIRRGRSQDDVHPRPHLHKYLKEFDLHAYSVDILDHTNSVQARHSITPSSELVGLLRYNKVHPGDTFI